MNSIGRPAGSSRRDFLKTAAAMGAGITVWSKRGKSAGAPRPNILVLISDQESEVFEEEVARGLLHLPNRESLEQRGIRLTRVCVTAPQCSPSRSTLMTGLYPHNAGVVTNVDRGSLGRTLPPAIPTLGKAFRDQGYTTAYLGKWHLTNGIGGGVSPAHDSKALEAYGFDHYHFMSDSRAHHDQLADAAANWIKEAPSTPWLLVVSFPFSPHDIYDVVKLMPTVKVRPGVKLPPNFDDNLRTKPRFQEGFLQHDQGKVTLDWGKEEWLRYRSFYLELIERIDSYLGKILAPLRSRPDADNTVVVYTSDHGDMGGAHHLPFKGPFMYDELLRVPMVISWPRRFRSPVVSDSMVSNVDLMPTLAGMAGIEWPRPLPGKDFSLLFDYPKETIRAAVFAEYYGKQNWVVPIRTIRTADWKYNVYVQPGREDGEELYHLKADPGELRNLSHQSAYAEPLANLRARLLRWRRETQDPFL